MQSQCIVLKVGLAELMFPHHCEPWSPKAVHRVELTVDEDGEEEDVSHGQIQPEPGLAALHFNRSFLLLILDEASNSLLFMGKVVNPTRANMNIALGP